MKECIIFGAGSFGRKGYYKLHECFHILAYTDNNSNVWGTSINGINIIAPSDIPKNENIAVIICSTYYQEIRNQLGTLGVKNIWYINPQNFLLQKCDENAYDIYDSKKKLRKVLFVQVAQCIRTYRSAKILSEQGIEVDFAFLDKHPLLDQAFTDLPYGKIIPINSLKEFLEFVNKSDYDIIHCSNEPDYLTALLIQFSNKKIIHDTHDMVSLKRECSMDELVNEYVANVKADGNLYVTDEYANIARNKFGVDSDKIMVIPNLPLKEFLFADKIEKRSLADGQIHCVYEGSITREHKKSHRFLEPIFLKIAESHIHVHIYLPSTCNFLVEEGYMERLEQMNPYIHFEGCLEPKRLISELTQYDIGLAMYNVTERNKAHLANGSATKFYDYLAAKLPIAVADIDTHRKFVEENCVGKVIDLQDNILKQLEEVSSIKISDNILEEKKMYCDLYADVLIEFYEKILNNK